MENALESPFWLEFGSNASFSQHTKVANLDILDSRAKQIFAKHMLHVCEMIYVSRI